MNFLLCDYKGKPSAVVLGVFLTHGSLHSPMESMRRVINGFTPFTLPTAGMLRYRSLDREIESRTRNSL